MFSNYLLLFYLHMNVFSFSICNGLSMHGAQIHPNFSSSQPSNTWLQRETRTIYSTTLLIKSIQRQR